MSAVLTDIPYRTLSVQRLILLRHIEEEHEGDLAAGDDVHKPELETFTAGGDVEEADLETIGGIFCKVQTADLTAFQHFRDAEQTRLTARRFFRDVADHTGLETIHGAADIQCARLNTHKVVGKVEHTGCLHPHKTAGGEVQTDGGFKTFTVFVVVHEHTALNTGHIFGPGIRPGGFKTDHRGVFAGDNRPTGLDTDRFGVVLPAGDLRQNTEIEDGVGAVLGAFPVKIALVGCRGTEANCGNGGHGQKKFLHHD